MDSTANMSELSDAKALEAAQKQLSSIRSLINEFADRAYDPDYPESLVSSLAMFTLGQIAAAVTANDDPTT
jgi:hypothetical protein